MDKNAYNKVANDFMRCSAEIMRTLKEAIRKVGSVHFSDPIHAPALDEDGYYEDVMIVLIEWDDDGFWVATDDTGTKWTDDDFLPCVHEKIMDEMIYHGMHLFN